MHSPLQGAHRYTKKFKHIEDVHRRIFAAMLAQLDDGIGRVLERVRAERLEERTLVVFLNDNGGPTRELTSSNRPLRGEKGQLLEGGSRVPLLLQWKGRVPADFRSSNVPYGCRGAPRDAPDRAFQKCPGRFGVAARAASLAILRP